MKLVPWRKLSRPVSELGDEDVDILVIGSGYGGGVAASRLARAGQNVVLLERGREIAPGLYPNDAASAAKDFQITLGETGRKLNKDNPTALYDLRVGDNMNVLVGNGLGGTSLINANLAIEPDARVYKTWPKPYCDDPGMLAEYYDLARKMLGSKPYPEGRRLPKLDALEKVAEGMGAKFSRPDINVTFEDGFNEAGILQHACTDCGDCVSGCNYGAKNTTLMNYLPDAERHGARLYTHAEALSLRPTDNNRWLVTFRDVTADDASPRVLNAALVILAAGTLGSNEILLRSRKDLNLSPRLGHGFSGNGDIWAFAYNANIPDENGDRAKTYAIGAGPEPVVAGPRPPERDKYHPGPCITGLIDLRDDTKPLHEGVIFEEGVMPGALAMAYAAAFPAMAALLGDPMRFGDIDIRLKDAQALGKRLEEAPADFVDYAVYEGPLSRTLPFLVMAHDSSSGVLRLVSDELSSEDDASRDWLTLSWDGAGREDAIQRNAEIVTEASDAINAEYLPNPIWQNAMNDRLLTVHPLGGCGMGTTPEDGVVNAECQVFDTSTGAPYPGLFVCDGAVIPASVGVNPHLTITAVAEYAMARLAAKNGWSINYGRNAPPNMTPERSTDPDYAAALEQVLGGLKALDTAINGKAYELARFLLLGLWRNLYEPYSKLSKLYQKMFPLPDAETLIERIGSDDDLKTIVSPLVRQAVEILEPVEEKLAAGALLDVLTELEKAFGDFSPQISFEEKMSGHLTTQGLNDPENGFDPFEAAAQGRTNAWFQGKISADALKSVITPPNVAVIEQATFRSTDLGDFEVKNGKFSFLHPNPKAVEQWEMKYEGTLSPVAGGDDLSFFGYKTIEARHGSHWWRDLTELRVTISDQDGPVAHGMIKVPLENAMEQANDLVVEYDTSQLLKDAVAAHHQVSDQFFENKNDLPDLAMNREFRRMFARGAIGLADIALKNTDILTPLVTYYKTQVFARFGMVVLRSYGGIFSYMSNFQHTDNAASQTPSMAPTEVHFPEVEPGVYTKLTRYKGGDLGPVVIAGGFGTKASSFATPTVDTNLVQVLTRHGFDVWLHDYRGSGDIESSKEPFTLDDVALKDWPKAIDTILSVTQKKDVQALVHCVGSMSLFMALMAGETRVRSVICSQVGPHAITNWFNYAKSDAQIADWFADGLPDRLIPALEAMGLDDDVIHLAKSGLPFIDPRSPSQPENPSLDPVLDVMVWNVPSFAPVPCKSPTCHRINFIFGPSYNHAKLNQETHNAIEDMFGPVSTVPFKHIARIFAKGRVESADGSIDYWADPSKLAIPIHFIAGGNNQEMLPEATLRTWRWLRNVNDEALYSRKVYPGYGHMDCFIGQNASRDIFDDLVSKLKKPLDDG